MGISKGKDNAGSRDPAGMDPGAPPFDKEQAQNYLTELFNDKVRAGYQAKIAAILEEEGFDSAFIKDEKLLNDEKIKEVYIRPDTYKLARGIVVEKKDFHGKPVWVPKFK